MSDKGIEILKEIQRTGEVPSGVELTREVPIP